MNILKSIELCTLNGRIVWYIISIKWFIKKKKELGALVCSYFSYFMFIILPPWLLQGRGWVWVIFLLSFLYRVNVEWMLVQMDSNSITSGMLQQPRQFFLPSAPEVSATCFFFFKLSACHEALQSLQSPASALRAWGHGPQPILLSPEFLSWGLSDLNWSFLALFSGPVL